MTMPKLDLQNQPAPELQEQLKTSRDQLGKLRFALANKALPDSSQIGKLRRQIARLLTAINNQENKNGK